MIKLLIENKHYNHAVRKNGPLRLRGGTEFVFYRPNGWGIYNDTSIYKLNIRFKGEVNGQRSY